MSRLLVIKPSSLGDIVHGLQLIQSVKRQRPDLHVTWVVRDRFAGLVHAAPCVDEVIHFRRRDGLKGMARVIRDIRARRFDLVWDLQGLLRSGLMTLAAKAPRKVGRPDAREGSGLFYDDRVARPVADEAHALEVLLPFAPTVGAQPELSFPLALRDDARFAWQGFFAGDERVTCVIFTDSRGAGKEWPRFDELTALIFAQVPDVRVAWCAGKPAQPAVAVPAERFLNLTGCPLDQMIALVRQRAVFIGNDSGPMHLAAASGNRVLAIFGPTSPRRFGPFPPDSPRNRAVVAPDGRLDRLEPADVLAALQELRRSA